MTRATDPAKRIPKSLDTDTQLLGNYSLTDLIVAGLPGVIVVLATQVLLPSSVTVYGVPVTALTIPLAGLAIALGALFVYLTPGYTSSLDWLWQFLGFHWSETDCEHEEAKQYTQVERIHPRHNAIERTDGAFIGAVNVDPPTMALATEEEWDEKTEAFEDFVNTTVEFPIQVYSTTESFPTDEYLAEYEDRLADPDVKSNPKLEALIEHYIDWYERELVQRQMTIRDHYVIVPVTPEEVRFEHDSLLEKFAALPLLGILVQMCTAPSAVEERAAMVGKLDDRLRKVERGLRGIDECDAQRIDAEELTRLIGEFWAGHDLEHGDLSHRIRTTPIITTTHQ